MRGRNIWAGLARYILVYRGIYGMWLISLQNLFWLARNGWGGDFHRAAGFGGARGYLAVWWGMDLDRWFTRRPVLAERACLGLLETRREPVDWLPLTIRRKWRYDPKTRTGGAVEAAGRHPPLKGWDIDYKRWGRNWCPVCGFRTFHGGDWRESAGEPRWNKSWHAPCLVAHDVWTRYSQYAAYLARRQNWKCPITGDDLGTDHPQGGRVVLRDVEVDHRVPLWRVRLEADRHLWPRVLTFWGLQNLQALSRAGHAEKTRREARDRAGMRASQIAGIEYPFGA